MNVNPTALTLPHWRAAMARVRAGTGRARIHCIGDSTTMGAGAGSGGVTALNGAAPNCWPAALAKILSRWVPTSYNSFWTALNNPIPYNTYDPRVTLAANWGVGADQIFAWSPGSVNDLYFEPAGIIDTVYAYTVENGGGTAALNVNGGATLATLSSAGGPGVMGQIIPVPRGINTVTVVPNNNGPVYLMGMVTYDSTVPAVDIICDGQYGSELSNWTEITSLQPWWFHNTWLAPDLTIICLTINDVNEIGLAGLGAYINNMQALITKVRSTGDCVLMVGIPSNSANATDGITLPAYVAALKALAFINGVGLIDLSERWVSWAYTNAIMPYFDGDHAEAQGYQDVAQAVASAIAFA